MWRNQIIDCIDGTRCTQVQVVRLRRRKKISDSFIAEMIEEEEALGQESMYISTGESSTSHFVHREALV